MWTLVSYCTYSISHTVLESVERLSTKFDAEKYHGKRTVRVLCKSWRSPAPVRPQVLSDLCEQVRRAVLPQTGVSPILCAALQLSVPHLRPHTHTHFYYLLAPLSLSLQCTHDKMKTDMLIIYNNVTGKLFSMGKFSNGCTFLLLCISSWIFGHHDSLIGIRSWLGSYNVFVRHCVWTKSFV